jgi:aminoglycoside phosphotransferase (APT) family kinase protein
LPVKAFPFTIAHGDLIASNLLFEDSLLTAVLDFDSVHLYLRAADVACARRRADDDVVHGYLEVSELCRRNSSALMICGGRR